MTPPERELPPLLPSSDDAAIDLVFAIRDGQLERLGALLESRPELATVRIGDAGGWRTALHVTTDWPGYFPGAPDAVRLLLAAGADPNADTGGDRPETPLHWAASSDDVDVAEALLDGGADLETPGGSIGSPLDNAIGYGCWHVARLLAARGARVDKLWHAAALGMVARTADLLAVSPPPGQADLDQAFWEACHGGQRRTAALLFAAGADLTASPDYAHGQSALEAAEDSDTRRSQLAEWLRERLADVGAASDVSRT
ncbi:MAG TPA: ankyrin repeat domain-containing protein [Acidimicrobiales bacterium]|nr:ankyrin repeat domain-containing protein [Acidimicrobiales bacterium]